MESFVDLPHDTVFEVLLFMEPKDLLNFALCGSKKITCGFFLIKSVKLEEKTIVEITNVPAWNLVHEPWLAVLSDGEKNIDLEKIDSQPTCFSYNSFGYLKNNWHDRWYEQNCNCGKCVVKKTGEDVNLCKGFVNKIPGGYIEVLKKKHCGKLNMVLNDIYKVISLMSLSSMLDRFKRVIFHDMIKKNIRDNLSEYIEIPGNECKISSILKLKISIKVLSSFECLLKVIKGTPR